MLKLKNLQTKALALATTAGATLYGAVSFAQETGNLIVPSTGVGTRSIVAFDAGPKTAFCRVSWKSFKK